MLVILLPKDENLNKYFAILTTLILRYNCPLVGTEGRFTEGSN